MADNVVAEKQMEVDMKTGMNAEMMSCTQTEMMSCAQTGMMSCTQTGMLSEAQEGSKVLRQRAHRSVVKAWVLAVLLLMSVYAMTMAAGAAELTHIENGVQTVVSGKWVRDSGGCFFKTTDGQVLKGWLVSGSRRWYCKGKKGYRLTGLKKVEGKRYYFQKNGTAAVSRWYGDGKLSRKYNSKSVYYFGSDGAALTGTAVAVSRGKAQACVFSASGKYKKKASEALRNQIDAASRSLTTPLDQVLGLLGIPKSANVMKMGEGTAYPLCIGDGIGNRYFYDGYYVDSVYVNSVECFVGLEAS